MLLDHGRYLNQIAVSFLKSTIQLDAITIGQDMYTHYCTTIASSRLKTLIHVYLSRYMYLIGIDKKVRHFNK